MSSHRCWCNDVPAIHDVFVRVFALDSNAVYKWRARQIIVYVVQVDVVFAEELVRLEDLSQPIHSDKTEGSMSTAESNWVECCAGVLAKIACSERRYVCEIPLETLKP